MTELAHNLTFRIATSIDIPKCLEIETASYPEDEAATLESLSYRQKNASPYFLLCCQKQQGSNDEILGFICATRCKSFTHESLYTHDPTGKLLAIHSVVIAQPHRRKGIATCMLQKYILSIRQYNSKQDESDHGCIQEIVLMAKLNLLGFYVHCGFRVERESDIVHGQDMWYDLRMTLDSTDVSPCVSSPSEDEKGRDYFIVDSFAFSPNNNNQSYGGTGNPAAVVLMREGERVSDTPVHWLQKIAAEFNLSETAFLWKMMDKKQKKQQDGADWDIRYYTPDGTEIDLCGHATLASAHVLLIHKESSLSNNNTIVFSNNQNILLPASAQIRNSTTTIHMNFPWKNVIPISSTSLSSATIEMLRASLQIQNPSNDVLFIGAGEDDEDLFVELTYEAFHNLPSTHDISYSHMVSYPGPRRGIIVCCLAPTTNAGSTEIPTADIDFYSRFFGPKAGINEDPVTGSAHCLLGPYFGNEKKLGKNHVVGMQKSQRGGVVQCFLKKDERIVEIVGEALLVMRGNLCV